MNAEQFSPYGHTYDVRIFGMLRRLTAARVAGKEHALRPPPTALKLKNGRGALLVLKPELVSSPTGWKLAPSIDAELLVGLTIDGVSRPAFALRVKLHADGTIRPRRWWKNAARTRRVFETMLGMLDTFANDPDALLSHSTNCCICGRALTDDASRARGIGPECAKFGNFVLRVVAEKGAA